MSFTIGETVGRYRITEQLGQGGMATVYRAYDANLDRDVAIKVMHQALNEDPAFLTRFKREAQIVAILRHPHLVTIYEFDEHHGQPYLVMEFINGITLKSLLKQRMLTASETLAIMRAVASALTYAHDQGVLHRDIKPSNILIDQNNAPYVTDFGLARMVQAGESTLSQDMMLGTPQYISPEQAQGVKALGPATDIYSLGIVLYQLIVGRVPFSADTPYAIVHDHIYKPLPLPSEVNPQVSPAIERVLLKSLSKEPQDRYHSAVEMIDALEEALGSSHIAADASIAATALPPHPTPSATLSPAIPAVTPAKDSLQSSGNRPVRRTRGSLWMLGGLAAFVCTCILALLVAASTLADPGLRAQSVDQIPTEQSAAIQHLPVLSVEEARIGVEESPNDPVLRFAYALALLRADQRLLAQDAMREAMALADNNPELIGQAAREAASNGYVLEALQLFSEAVEQSNNIELRNQAGEFMYELALNADRRQIIILQRLVDSNPNSAGAHAMLARAYITTNQLPLADETINHALSIDGSLPESHLILGDLYAAIGNIEQAQAEWRYAATAADSPPWVIETATESLHQSQA